MKVLFNLCKLRNCGIKIIDNSTYLDSDEFVYQEYKASDVFCIDVLEKHVIGQASGLTTNIVQSFEESEFKNLKDGWYTLHHIILPSKDYFERLKGVGGVLFQYDTFYYADSEKFYKFKSGSSEEVSITEIIERNPINTSILEYKVNYFSVCDLNECYIRLAKASLDSYIRCKPKAGSELLFNRDVVWMTLNVIKYYVELGELENAEIMLSKLNTCNGFCKHLNRIEGNEKGCGCGN